MIASLNRTDGCAQSLKSLNVKAFAPRGPLQRSSEVTLSEAATRIAAGKRVTLEEDLHTPVEAHESILLGWRSYDTTVDVVQKLKTPIANAEELKEFADFRAGVRDTDTQKLAGRLASKESGENSESFNLIAPTHNGIFGGHKVDFKIPEADGDTRVLPSLSAFAAARDIQNGQTVAVAQMDINSLLQLSPDYANGLQSQLVASPIDLR